MVEAEKLAFGPDSYFLDPELARARAAKHPDSDSDTQSTLDDEDDIDSTHGSESEEE